MAPQPPHLDARFRGYNGCQVRGKQIAGGARSSGLRSDEIRRTETNDAPE